MKREPSPFVPARPLLAKSGLTIPSQQAFVIRMELMNEVKESGFKIHASLLGWLYREVM